MRVYRSINNNTILLSFFAFLFIIVLLFAGLIYAGHWGADEFFVLADVKARGFSIFIDRVLTWSPRFFSETLLALYFYVILAGGERLVVETLVFLWAFLVFVPFIGVYRNGKNDKIIAFVILCLLVTLISGKNNSDILYWPQGAVAYIPTFALALFITARILGMTRECDTPTVWDYLAWCLLLSSSEAGLFAVMPLSLLVVGWVAFERRQIEWGAAVVFLYSILVLALVLRGRATHTAEAFNDLGIAGNLYLSVIFGIKQFITDIFFYGGNVLGSGRIWLGILPKLSLFLGLVFILRSRQMSRPQLAMLLIWAASCLFASFAITFSSYYKFGSAGSARHIAAANLYIWMALVSLAAVTSQYYRLKNVSSKCELRGLVLIFAAAVFPVALLAGGIIHDYKNIDELVMQRDEVFKAGQSPGDDLVVSRCPPGRIVGAVCTYLPAGNYAVGDGQGWIADAMLRYFGKQRLTVRSD